MKRLIISASLPTAGVMLLGAVAAQAAPLSASASPDERAAGLWYADRLKFDELQAQGATGEGIKIAVIDGGINLDEAELQGANVEVNGSYCAFPETGEPVPAVSDDLKRSSHGTEVVSMLVGNGKAADGGLGTRGIVPDAEVRFYAYGLLDEEALGDGPGCEKFDPSRGEFFDSKNVRSDSPGYFLGGVAAYAAWNAVNDVADIVVYSGIGTDIAGWSFALQRALRSGVPIVAGTPNPDGDIDSQISRSFPYGLNGAVSVSGVDNDGNLLNGGGNDALTGDAQGARNLGFLSAASALLTPSAKEGWEPSIGYGTSLATPLVAGTIALGMEQYPDATANQVLQTMIRTTGTSGLHEPEWHGKEWGYGVTNPIAMLQVDPMTYPDENPLFVTSVDDPRCTHSDGTVPVEIENCSWAVGGPYFEDVWPTGGANGAGPPKGEVGGDTPASPMLPIVLTVGGVVLAGIVVAAIVAPIVVTRSRKRRIQASPPGAVESEAYRG